MDPSSAARLSSFWISTPLKRKNQCVKKVSNCICHNNSNQPHFSHQRLSKDLRKAKRRDEKFCEKYERGKKASQPQEFFSSP